MQQQQQQQLMTSNRKQLKQKGKEHQPQQRNKLLRLRPQTRNLKCDNNANNSNNNMIINNNANMMINAQVARGNNYSLPMHVSQEACEDINNNLSKIHNKMYKNIHTHTRDVTKNIITDVTKRSANKNID